jgi:hypothetical protein
VPLQFKPFPLPLIETKVRPMTHSRHNLPFVLRAIGVFLIALVLMAFSALLLNAVGIHFSDRAEAQIAPPPPAVAASAVAVPPSPLRRGAGGEAAVRRLKCQYLWQQVAPWSYSPALSDYFVEQHELAGMPDQWYWSLVYGFSNFGLTLGHTAPGLCYSPMDVKWPGYARQVGAKRPEDLRDPHLNIRAHVAEMACYHRTTGREGLALLSMVFLPAHPREYHRWRPTDARFRKLLSTWYASHNAR